MALSEKVSVTHPALPPVKSCSPVDSAVKMMIVTVIERGAVS